MYKKVKRPNLVFLLFYTVISLGFKSKLLANSVLISRRIPSNISILSIVTNLFL